MNSTQATKLQEQITKEALALLSIGGTEIDVSQHEQVIRLTGTAWRLSSEDTDAMLDLIQQEKMVMQKLEAGEQATHIALNDEELLINWSGMETLETVEDLFETSLINQFIYFFRIKIRLHFLCQINQIKQQIIQI